MGQRVAIRTNPATSSAASAAHARLGASARDRAAGRPAFWVALMFLEGLREPAAALAEQRPAPRFRLASGVPVVGAVLWNAFSGFEPLPAMNGERHLWPGTRDRIRLASESSLDRRLASSGPSL